MLRNGPDPATSPGHWWASSESSKCSEADGTGQIWTGRAIPRHHTTAPVRKIAPVPAVHDTEVLHSTDERWHELECQQACKATSHIFSDSWAAAFLFYLCSPVIAGSVLPASRQAVALAGLPWPPRGRVRPRGVTAQSQHEVCSVPEAGRCGVAFGLQGQLSAL